MLLYKLATLLLLNIVFVQAWYTTVVENGTTIVRTKSRSRSSTATASSTTNTSSTTTTSPTTTTSSTITTSPTTTTTAAVSSPTYTLTYYGSADCSDDIIQNTVGDGCYGYANSEEILSYDTSSSGLTIKFYTVASCAGEPDDEFGIASGYCYDFPSDQGYMSYSVTAYI